MKIEFEIKNGKPYYSGYLDLRRTNIIELPDNLTVEGFLVLRRSGITRLPDNLTVGGYLDLRATKITELPEGLTVGGYLELRGTGITQLPEGLTVGGYLDLIDTDITELPEDLTVGGSLYLSGIGITELPKGLTIGDSLDLINTGITSLPDSLTVGGSLDLKGAKITELPNGLTVGGYLDLRATKITELPEDLTVGGSLFLRGTGITDTSKVNRNAPSFFQWRNGEYIKVDRIFSKVVSHRGNVYKVCQIGETKERYVVTDGAGKWAHGDTLQEAKDDLIYKISHRDKSAYENLSLDSELTFVEAIEAYRVITGACSAGTKMFVENGLTERKEKYTISEIIRLTKGQYNNKG